MWLCGGGDGLEVWFEVEGLWVVGAVGVGERGLGLGDWGFHHVKAVVVWARFEVARAVMNILYSSSVSELFGGLKFVEKVWKGG